MVYVKHAACRSDAERVKMVEPRKQTEPERWSECTELI